MTCTGNRFDVPVEDRTLQNYLDEARGMIARWGPRWMIKDDDANANVATAIAKAEYNFDPSRGNKRITVRITYGRYEIIKEIRNIKKWSNRPKHFSIDTERTTKNEYTGSSIQRRTDNDPKDYREPEYSDIEIEEEIEYKKALARSIIRKNKTMTGKQKEYITMKYVKGMTEKNMSEKLGCSKQAVNQVIRAAITNLKKELL
jgi:RNA polymerase sigma factor (sigma-70 family)